MPELAQTRRLTRPMVGELIERHGLQPSRALGQNFLCEPGVVDKIVRLSGVQAGDDVIEIGPGLGSLTLGLADTGARVTAIEADRYLIPGLTEVLETAGLADRVTVVHADAMHLDWGELLGGRSWNVVANLPYNVSTPLVLDLLRDQPALTQFLVMVQHEAGARLAAGSGSRTYGIPSVLLSYWATARVVDTVPNSVFLPRPRVASALLKIERHERPLIDAPFDRYATLVRAGFGQRRKMLRRSLAGLLSVEQIEQAGVAPTDRAEDLAPEQWGALAQL
ncbi:MAG: 16S rRNA (adenine(1518)-N(6)/adenine(1519)-N(6))-dimethyltransferase RsmA [Acidimicrobiales bacterium]|nr:16S rRNA (adenine(1518)-N(6)/adenine(1519)-N(6))-dimethyltransferase RsmA [Acidimicrobiales bacterium]